MPYYTYIIFSPSLGKYYVGESEDLTLRLNQHNDSFFKGSFTSQVNDWQLFLSVKFDKRSKAKKFEQFIKRMKSRKFIESLKSDQAKLVDLLQKFS